LKISKIFSTPNFDDNGFDDDFDDNLNEIEN